MVQPNDIVIWAAAFVALWWVIDWLHMRQEGERLPMRRAPLRALGDVLPKLWRNKTFMLVLACLWLIGAAVAGVQRYFLALPPGVAEAGAVAPSLTESVQALLGRGLPDALPRLVEVPLGTWAALLFGVLLAAAMIRIIIDPPDRIGEETARQLRWPAGLLIAYLAVGVAMVAAPRGFVEGLADRRGGTILLTTGTMALMPALLAPAFALLWRLVLEIARDGVWSFVSSMRALAESWLPITLLVLLANALRPVVALGGDNYAAAWHYAYLALLVLLALTPWAIVDRREGLAEGLRRSWRLFRQRPVDAIAFGLRFTLLFVVLGALVSLAEPTGAAEWATWFAPLLDVGRNVLLLLQALVLARFYVHLGELLEQDDACAICPSARIAEGLEEQAESDE